MQDQILHPDSLHPCFGDQLLLAFPQHVQGTKQIEKFSYLVP
jgi:hypothetical protein